VPDSARPTGAMLRKSLFDLLANHYGEGCSFLDLYAGAGAVGLEAASRGYDATLVERDPRAARMIESNSRTLGLEAHVVRADARRYLETVASSYDVVFVDPPYAEDIGRIALAAVSKAALVEDDGVLVVQSPSGLALPPGGEHYRVERRQYGSNSLTLYWRR
jgi:16S rRNA (guanine966-N2)-methyltransferase